MVDAAVTTRGAARAELDAYQVMTDRYQAQLGALAQQPGAAIGIAADGDITALAFTVMMEAARSARDDLRAVMADIKAINAAKAGLRRRLQPGKPPRKADAANFDVEAAVQLAATLVVAGLGDEVRDMLRDRRDTLDEMGELDSLRLQMAMDRVSKLMSTLSNLLKQLADTQSAIVQNLK